jgi:threonine/homoserine/homoserine lactone efflux protein
MPSSSTLATFLAATVVIILFPGPAMLFLVATGAAGGRRVGAMSAVGVESATAVYVVATALGLTAVLAASATALSLVRYAGAAYLIWLGVRLLRRPAGETAAVPDVRPARHAWAIWRDGFLVGISNPKIALFFLAFFPQFVHPDAGPAATQVLILGTVFVATGLMFDVGYGVAGGSLRRLAAGRRPGLRRTRVAAGLTYIGIGGLTAATGHRAA